MTLSGLHQKYLRYCEVERRMSPQTVVAYRSDFRQFTEALGDQARWGLASQDRLETLSADNVRAFQYAMAQAEYGWATIQRRLVALNRFACWLVKRGYLSSNPLVDVERPKRERRLPETLPWDDVIRAALGERRPLQRAILSLLGFAGLRRGEVIGLRVGNYDPKNVTLHVRGKGNKDRVVALPRLASEPLDEYLAVRGERSAEAPLFVTAYGRPIASNVVTRAARRAGTRIGRRVHPHMFRHSYATELHDRGADIRDIRDLLGHESVSATEIYTHVSTARQKKVVSLLEK